MNKIEKLENPVMGLNVGCGGSSLDDVISKVNEIIDALNGKEEPEPRESEDERIRKEIIGYLNSRVPTAEETELLYFKRWIAWLERQKEQKPASTEDMPYITDEHFYEREPADSFKYKLAEYMTRCCTKKEGPYGYEYGISAESILKMAEEELLKKGASGDPDPAGVWKPTPAHLEALEVAISDFREDGCDTIANYLQEIYNEIEGEK